MPQMKTNFKGLIQLLARNLYPEPDVFIRELVQNAHDAIKIRQLDEPNLAGRIEILTDAGEKTITFVDNGGGMNANDIEEFLSTVGASGTRERAMQYLHEGNKSQALGTIGQFGIGILSAFVVARKLEVITKKRGSQKVYRWINEGGEDYSLDEVTDKAQTGTTVRLTLQPDRGEFLDEKTIRKTITRYAEFIPFRIDLNGEGPINAMDAPWHKSGWAGDGDYKNALREFLNKRFPDSPMLVIPIKFDQPKARGALYISDRHVPGINTPGLLDIFQERMCIRINDSELLPEWAKFVRGVIDSPALTPTAARDNVQKDANYRELKRQLGRLIVEELTTLAKSDPRRFEQLCAWHHYHLKGMALHHDDFFNAVIDSLPFETNEGKMNLPRYLERQPAKTGEKVPVYFFSYGGDSNQFYDLCRAKGLVAINTGFPFDEEVLRKYVGRNSERMELRQLDTLDDPNLYRHLSVDERKQFLAIEHAVNEALKSVGHRARVEVETRRFLPAHMSGALIGQEQFDRQKVMEGIAQQIEVVFGGDMARDLLAELRTQSLRLILNADNPLVQRLAGAENIHDSRYTLLLVGLFNAAIIYSQQMSVDNARIIYAQFQHHMLRALDLEDEVTELRKERLQQPGLEGSTQGASRPWIRLFVMMSYGESFRPLEVALRSILQSPPYYFEVVLARDRIQHLEKSQNIASHIRGADGFIADVSDHSPNVFLELGWPRFAPEFSSHLKLVLHSKDGKGVAKDLDGLVHIEYDSPASPDLAKTLASEFSKSDALSKLLLTRKERFLSADLLKGWGPCQHNSQIRDKIASEYRTIESLCGDQPDAFKKKFIGAEGWIGNLFESLREYLKQLPGNA